MSHCCFQLFCYVLLLGAQIAVFVIQSSLYAAESGHVTNQTVFLAFYRNDFMHSVLPLEGIVRWITNILILLGCGGSVAIFTYLQRRGKAAWSLFVVVACILVGFIEELGELLDLVMAIIVWAIVARTAYYHVLRDKED